MAYDFNCPYCGYGINRDQIYDQVHEDDHLGEFDVKCLLCKKEFTLEAEPSICYWTTKKEQNVARTAKEIVDQTHKLAEQFYASMGYEHDRENHGNLYESQHPTEQAVWRMACMAQIELTDTDPADALGELEEED